jgi:hypothetical protein
VLPVGELTEFGLWRCIKRTGRRCIDAQRCTENGEEMHEENREKKGTE